MLVPPPPRPRRAGSAPPPHAGEEKRSRPSQQFSSPVYGGGGSPRSGETEGGATGERVEQLNTLLTEIRACRICAPAIEPKPLLRASATSRIAIVSQAPGIRAHDTGLSFNDPSGDRLRAWMGIDRDTFYDQGRVAVVSMGFCFPGHDASGGDAPPRKECAPAWRARLFAALPEFPLTLLVGSYAIAGHLGPRAKANVHATVTAWREYTPRYLPLPHPSWRNNAWLAKNPWFEDELLPYLRRRVRTILKP